MRKVTSTLSLLLILLAGMSNAEEATITLGPWLQFTDPQSAVLHWQTNTPVPSKVDCSLTKQVVVENTDFPTEHKVVLNGLPRHTQGEFRIGLPNAEGTVAWQSFDLDTSFNYSLPVVSDASTPFTQEAMTRTVHPDFVQAMGEEGYGIILGCGEGELAWAVVKNTNMQIIGLDKDADAIQRGREKLLDTGYYGSRITLRTVDSLDSLPFTDKMARRVVVACDITEAIAQEALRLIQPDHRGRVLYRETATAPACFGKTLPMWGDPDSGWRMTSYESEQEPGSWTHQYGTPDNTARSNESLSGVGGTTDLQVQWLGRPGPRAMVDRNPRTPSPLYCNKMLYTQGFQRIIAQNAYSGTIEWSLELPGFMRYNIPRDCSNWCADWDGVYLAHQGHAWFVVMTDGHVGRTYPVVSDRPDRAYDWGFIAYADKTLYGSAVLKESAFTGWLGKQFWYDKPTGKPTEKVCSDVLFALDRNSGAAKWQRKEHLVMNPTITIADGTVFFVEIRDAKLKAGEERRIAAKQYKGKQYLVALDAETGEVRWERKMKADPGSVVCYLLHADDTLIYATSDKKYGLFAYDAASGERLWSQHHDWTGADHSGHMQHPVILAGTVYLEPRGYALRTGELVTETVGRHGGCATYMAVENALIYRGPDRQTSMWDIEQNTVTNWTRLRPSCWLSTIAGAGMVLAPEAGGGCSCGGWMETSVAFAPVVVNQEG